MGETKTDRFAGQDPAKGVNREPLKHNFAGLNWEFLRVVAEICPYAAAKYGSVEQYADIRPEGEQSPLNHIFTHAGQYIAQTPHDKFGDVKYHLAAIAYNAMMEYYYLTHGGPTTTDKLYRQEPEIPEDWPGIKDEVVPAVFVENLIKDNIELSIPTPFSSSKETLKKFFGGLGGGKREGTVSESGN